MDKLVINMELFYERNEKGFGYEDKNLNALHGQERADIGDLIINTISQIENYSFKYIYFEHSNYDFAVGETICFYSILESSVLENWITECEIRIELKELTEENFNRLKELGYDPEIGAKHAEYRRPMYWTFRCSVYEGNIIYRYPENLEEVEELLRKSEDEMLKAECAWYQDKSIDLIEKESYRKWLRTPDIGWRIGYERIVVYAPISISEKLNYIRAFKKGSMKTFAWPNIMDISENSYHLAYEMISEDSPVSSYVLHEKERIEENGCERIKDTVTTCRTFDDVRNKITAKYNNSEPDEFGTRWNIVELFDLKDGNYEKRAIFLVSEKGEIWHVKFPWHRKLGKDKKYFFNEDLSELDVANPYKDGDIILIDCQPFCKPYYALVLSEGDGEPSCSPWCLWISEGRLYCEFLCHDNENKTMISPLYRSEIYKGELPEECRILAELSRLIKTDSPILSEIRKLINRYSPDKVEKKLWELLEKQE